MHSRRAAMSLIEVTLVILIIGILAAVSAPRLSDSYHAMQLQTAARQMAAHIDYIRAIAINEGRTTQLVCDNNLHSYGSDSVEFPERIGELIQVSLPEFYDSSFTLSADFDTETTLAFDFDGVPRVNSSAMVDGSIVLASGNHQFSVTIAAGTGKTHVARVPSGGGGGGSSPPHQQQTQQQQSQQGGDTL